MYTTHTHCFACVSSLACGVVVSVPDTDNLSTLFSCPDSYHKPKGLRDEEMLRAGFVTFV